MRNFHLLLLLMFFIATVQTDAQKKTFMEPLLYGNGFKACGPDAFCTRTVDFALKSIPNDCCVLEVFNGRSKDRQVGSYEVFLNGDRIITPRNSEYASAAVRLSNQNNLKVVLKGEPQSGIMVMFAYAPPRPK